MHSIGILSCNNKNTNVLRDIFGTCIRGVKQVLFPVFCIDCAHEGSVLCQYCQKKISISGVFFCPGCREPSPQGHACTPCKKTDVLDQHVALFVYGDKSPVVSQLIEIYKYQFEEEVCDIFRVWIQTFFEEHMGVYDGSISCIVPVPLHKKRFAERGFNQSAALATALSDILDVPVVSLLSRGKHTKQQARLKKEEREENVKGAFHIVPGEGVYEHVLLVDDVFTTGSTMRACARALRSAGVAKVSGWSLARGE